MAYDAEQPDPIQNLRAFAKGRKFRTILADPPWQFQNRTGKVAPEHKRLNRYPTMDLQAICDLPVAEVAADPAAADPASFTAALLTRMDTFSRAIDGVDLYRVAIQGWAFAQSDGPTRDELAAVQGRLTRRLATVAGRWSDEEGADTGLADVVLACVLGHVVRAALGFPAAPADIASGLRNLGRPGGADGSR